MTLKQIKDYIRNNSENDIYTKFLLGQEVWYFVKNIKDEDPLLFYDKFKKIISNKLNIRFNNISIIGSAKTNYSFSPNKQFRAFNEESDFDIILVSNDLFNRFWTAYYEISKVQQIQNYQRLTSNIFNKFISIKEDGAHYNNDSLMDWQRKLSGFRTELQLEYKIYNEINYRIYSSWEDVENYHLKGISKLKAILNETN